MNSRSNENWLIVGLGNPGERYRRTRHNLGFMLVDLLAENLQSQVKRDECRALVGRAEIGGKQVELVKPQTFMNLSGESVTCLLKKDQRDRARMIVAVDDLALPLGSIRLRRQGSDGGHNGLKSVAACLKTEEYIRLRIGIRPDHPISDSRRFVLENFSPKEFEKVREILGRSADAITAVLSDGIEKAMAEFNRDLESEYSDAEISKIRDP